MRETFEEAGVVSRARVGITTGDITPARAREMVVDHRDAGCSIARLLSPISSGWKGSTPALTIWCTSLIGRRRSACRSASIRTFSSFRARRARSRSTTAARWSIASDRRRDKSSTRRQGGAYAGPGDEAQFGVVGRKRHRRRGDGTARARNVVMVRPERFQTEAGGWAVRIPADAGYKTTVIASGGQRP